MISARPCRVLCRQPTSRRPPADHTLRSLWLSAADALDFVLNFRKRTDGQPRAVNRIEQILPPRIDGNPPLGYDHVDQPARLAKRGNLVHYHRDPVAERGQREDGATGSEAVLPSTDAVEKTSVGMSDYIWRSSYRPQWRRARPRRPSTRNFPCCGSSSTVARGIP
jgi:hypothetical protein